MRVTDQGEQTVIGGGGLVPPGVRVYFDRGPGVPGRSAVVSVPFSGELSLFGLQPSSVTLNPPQAVVGSDHLEFRFEYESGSRPDLVAMANAEVQRIEGYLRAAREDVEQFNVRLESDVPSLLSERRQRILTDREHLDGLSIPVSRRGDAPKTYAAPGIERAAAPELPASGPSATAELEPTLIEDFYRHIISVIAAMARGMERNPGDYSTWDEEKLRDALLVILNTHYVGQATGETFNKGGKTDILVRVEDRNVFVGECKVWTGQAAFAGPGGESALDQLLGYATWRDAKLALAVFVHAKTIENIIESARDALAAHPSFLQWSTAGEGQLKCRVRMSDAGDKAADLAVVFVHLPR
jgi:hypothetical protein